MLPNFLIVGAEKAGTTSLSALLADHPEVFICDPKEPRFFSHHNWDRGLRWYESLFNKADGYKAIGEASPAYTWAPESIEVPKRVQQCLGDIKYLYILRHPIERIISHYRHALFYRWIPANSTLEIALDLKPGLKNCSRYFYQIQQYLQYTRRDQWHIVVLEELIEDYRNIVNDIFRFLDIGKTSLTHLPSENVSDEKVRPWIMLERLRPLRPFLPKSIRQLGRQLNKNLGKKIEKPDILVYTRSALMEELRPDIQRLSVFCEKDFQAIWDID